MKSLIPKILLENGYEPFDWDIEELYSAGRKNLQMNIEFYWDKDYPCKSVINSLFIEGITQYINRKGKSKTELLIEEKTKQITEEKEKIKEKSKEILQSIEYGSNLQKSILPSRTSIDNILNKHFIMFRPKDIIGGDFYWFDTYENYIYFAVADCTGHGVPGGMVSLIGVTALNKSLKELKLIETNQILDSSRNLIIETFNKNGQNINDGMDIIICRWDPEKRILQYSGANRPLWILRESNGLIEEFKTDRFPVGKFFDMKSFTSWSIELFNNDILFLFSDGLVDQFGESERGKFKTSRLRNLILKNRDYHYSLQGQYIETELLNWKGSNEQTDDITLWLIQL